KVAAILEAKRPGRDLYAALEQARTYAQRYTAASKNEVSLIFASDGLTYLRQNLKANTLPEKLNQMPTPAEFREFFRPQADILLGTLRDYQRVAISQVTAAMQSGRTKMYVQMATGTGKTITAAGVIAKLWSLGLVRRVLFLVDRDALAEQAVDKLKTHLGDNLTIRRATGDREDQFADVLVTTVQHLAVRDKYRRYPYDQFQLVILDECHRSYFGDWHGVLEHFYSGGARLLGLTATPSDKETLNTDRYFSDPGVLQGPIYRYTIRQGEQENILAKCIHFKFHTNVDLYGIHDMGFDFEPDQLGRAVDVPERNRLIAEKYFEVSGRREPVKTIVFAASIQHAIHLRYALIERYNELNHLPPNDATAERFIVAIHNEVPNARELLQEFQQIDGPLKIAVGVGMLDTGIDAPDVEMLLMARPTKSKILYVQMKGRGTRKCVETGKEFYRLVDFVDITRLEELVTNETPGVVDIDEQEDQIELSRAGLKSVAEGETVPAVAEMVIERQEMVILDVPVTLESSEVIAPTLLEDLKRQLEAQLKQRLGRESAKDRFLQTLLAWQYFNREAIADHTFLGAMGFDLHTLRDLYGEPEATLEDFVNVALGRSDFEHINRRRRLELWGQDKGLTFDQRELVLMLVDFKQANPEITPQQILRSQWLEYHGGLYQLKQLFPGGLKELIDLANQAVEEVV
ncbi:MAG: DEAD/DEAH box helicase family protein, partial [Chloroflexi bacterium]|nr:DEAD/DEAH box helicase family protein [Chloroflexota bacterium]